LERELKDGQEKTSTLKSNGIQLEKETVQLRELNKKASEAHYKQKSTNSLANRLAENKKKNQDSLQQQDDTIQKMREHLGIKGDIVDSTTVMLDEEIIRYRTLLELADFKLMGNSLANLR